MIWLAKILAEVRAWWSSGGLGGKDVDDGQAVDSAEMVAPIAEPVSPPEGADKEILKVPDAPVHLQAHTAKWFVRQLSTNEAKWRDGEGDEQTLAKGAFGCDERNVVSVYLADSERGEASIMAALQVGRSQVAPTFGLRITASDLSDAGIQVDDNEKGTTGVASVDRVHRDLVGSGAAFLVLTRRLLKDQIEGASRVRELRRPPLLHQLRTFNSLPGAEMSGTTRNKLKNMLDRHPLSPRPGE